MAGQMDVQVRQVPELACAASLHAWHTRAKFLMAWGLPRRWHATRVRTPKSRTPESGARARSRALGVELMPVKGRVCGSSGIFRHPCFSGISGFSAPELAPEAPECWDAISQEEAAFEIPREGPAAA